MKILLNYENGAMGDTLALLPFVKDFTEQRPNDVLYLKWKTNKYLWYMQRDIVFSHLDAVKKYNGEEVDLEISVTSDKDDPSQGPYTPILSRPYMEFEKMGIFIEKRTHRIPWDFKDEELKRFEYNEDKPLALINVGFHHLVSSKNWGVLRYQQLVNDLKDRINFIQVGETIINGFKHLKLNGTYLSLINKTTLSDLAALMYSADFVFTNVTGTNLLATIPSKKKRHVFTFMGARENQRMFSDIRGDDTLDYRLLGPPHSLYANCIAHGADACYIDTISKCKCPITLEDGEIIPACLNVISEEYVVSEVNKILEQSENG